MTKRTQIVGMILTALPLVLLCSCASTSVVASHTGSVTPDSVTNDKNDRSVASVSNQTTSEPSFTQTPEFATPSLRRK